MTKIKTNAKNEYSECKAMWMICFLVLFFIFMMMSEKLYPLNCPLLGHDGPYHYLRVEALAERIRSGNIFSGGIDYLFLEGMGYASSIAYPDVLLYIPALLRVAGVGIGKSMAIFLMVCNILTIASSFWCGYKITKSPISATVASIIFTTSFYRIDNMYTRFALGEVQSFIFLPFVIYGLYNLVFEKFNRPWVIAFGIAGLLLTHTLTTAIALIMCVLFCLAFIRRIVKSPKIIFKLLVTAVCVLALTSFYWIPLLELMNSAEFTVHHPVNKASSFTVDFLTVFKDLCIGYGNAGLGILIFAICGIRVLIRSPKIKEDSTPELIRKKELLIFGDVCLVLAFVFVLLTIKTPLWKYLAPVLDFMQFPWRMYSVITLLISIAVAVYVWALIPTVKNRHFLPLVISFIFAVNAVVHINTIGVGHTSEYLDDYYIYNKEQTYNIGYGEWLPWSAKNIMDDVKKHVNRVFLNDGTEVEFERFSNYIEFTLTKPCDYAIIPYIWYKGYRAYDEGGNEYEVTSPEKGLVGVNLKDKTVEGKIRVKYHFTPLRTTAVIISIASALLIIACYGVMAVRRKKKHGTAENAVEAEAETTAVVEDTAENTVEAETKTE